MVSNSLSFKTPFRQSSERKRISIIDISSLNSLRKSQITSSSSFRCFAVDNTFRFKSRGMILGAYALNCFNADNCSEHKKRIAELRYSSFSDERTSITAPYP